MTMIQRHAYLSTMKDLAESTGRPVPPSVKQELAYIEMTARARLNPQQLAAAQQHSHALQAQYHEATARKRAADVALDADRKIKGHFEKALPGRSAQEVRAIAAGKPLPKPPARMSQAERDSATRAHTKKLDPSGIGWTEKEYVARLDELSDSDPKEFAQLAKSFKADPNKLRKLADDWQSERLSYGLAKRREAREGKMERKSVERIEPAGWESRRAKLADSWEKIVTDDVRQAHEEGRVSELGETFFTDEDSHLSNEQIAGGSPRRAALAQAWDEVKENG
jgi:hypothetical protein